MSSDVESYSAIRIKLVINTILPIFILPPLSVAICLRLFSAHLANADPTVKTIIYLFSIPLFLSIRIQIRKWKETREARRMGARQIPRLKGKWPGNLDIMIAVAESRKNTYLLDFFKLALESSGSNTINMNILWMDQVSTGLSSYYSPS